MPLHMVRIISLILCCKRINKIYSRVFFFLVNFRREGYYGDYDAPIDDGVYDAGSGEHAPDL